MKWIVSVALMLALSGCATYIPNYWYHDHKTQADFRQDKNECELVGQAAIRQGLVECRQTYRDCPIVEDCLYARGWRKGAIE